MVTDQGRAGETPGRPAVRTEAPRSAAL